MPLSPQAKAEIAVRDEIIRNMLGKGHPVREIADVTGLTTQRIYQIRKKMEREREQVLAVAS